MTKRGDWRPTATRAALERRARMLARARQFFAGQRVLEVDTPIVVNAPVTDVHIHSARVALTQEVLTGAVDADAQAAAQPYFLQTSPEYAMKRLLAAGSGDIYQVCHVVRGFERGRLHNSEFTLIEWYRIGYSLDRLMSEVEALARDLLEEEAKSRVTERVTYRDSFLRNLDIDPFTASDEELRKLAQRFGLDAAEKAPRDEVLEFLMGTRVGPQLGRGGFTFVYAYPASQAALARLDPHDPRAALRFELYADGIELANGFHELASAAQQRSRFELDQAERQRRGLPTYALDERLLAALEAGLPDCAGVALGFDRLVMLASKADALDEVMAFPTERA